MRIVVVSAHYPPNFVSGGTLAPQRQARHLRRLGHDVSVYAGWLGARPPLDTWSESDEEGMPVRWIVTTPWTGWDLRKNYDNPAVAADFADHLDAVRPDVVHFHSMQSLGAGLLDVAADRGARVVVTMHDFWWCCARQFLVDRDFEPCCLVVSCGDCQCQVDRDWLTSRNRFLTDRLARADAILGVSRAAAGVLAANGLDGGRLDVDENGLPTADQTTLAPVAPHPPTLRQVAPHGVVRFTYAGGENRLKGVHVMVEAAKRLADDHGRPGWTLTAYGIAPYLDETATSLAGLPVDVRDAFAPDEADAVFANTDMLIVPSIMESYSLITREALLRGVPVLSSDTLGPSEVIEHARNGLIVPAGDATALAATMASVVDDPALLTRLRGGGTGLVVRSLDEQIKGLETLYRELVGREGPNGRRARRVARVVFMVGIEGAPLRYRAWLPAEALALEGVSSTVRHYRSAELPALVRDADALVVYRVPATAQALDIIDMAREQGVPVFYDVDDLIFDPDLTSEISALSSLPQDERDLYLEGVRRYRTTLEACDAFIGSTEALRRHVEEVVGLPTFSFANGVGVELARRSEAALRRPRTPGPLRMGYLSGTKTHDGDWSIIEPVIIDVLTERPEVELWLGGLVTPSPALDALGDRVRRLPFLPWDELPQVLRDIDVNLAPLERSRFNEAKSAIKWLEAALTATPTVATATRPFRDAIRHGENGMLAEAMGDWKPALLGLLDDEGARLRIGHRALRDVLIELSPHRQGERYRAILEADLPRRPPAAGGSKPHWPEVIHDEPLIDVDLEPYPPSPTDNDDPGTEPDGHGVSPEAPLPPVTRGMRIRGLIRRGGRSLRVDGLRVTLARAGAVARRQVPKINRRIAARMNRP